MPDLIIKNAKILIKDSVQPAEIAVDRGRILKVGKIIDTQEYNQVIDAKGALVLPGAIDGHVHFREPGMAHKEDWYSGSCSAAAGGVTTVVDHPNTNPPTIDEASFRKKLKAGEKSIIDYGINGGVTSRLERIEELWSLGVTAFGEIFMAETTMALAIDEKLLGEALKILQGLGAVACLHAEDEAVRHRYGMLLKGEYAPEVYSRARPSISEATAVKKAIKIAGDARVHICHVSAGETLEVLRTQRVRQQLACGASSIIEKAKGKEAGVEEIKITCEAAPHHLFLSVKDWERLGTFGKMNPPLRDTYSQTQLWKALNEGVIDIIASDHAPHLEAEKKTDIWSAPAGVPGVETMLPLMLMAVKRNLLSLRRLVEVTSSEPARIFDFRGKGGIWAGFDADLVILGEPQTIKPENLHSKAGWTPYSGMAGIFPAYTIARGEVVWGDGEILGKKGRGRFLPGKGFKAPKERILERIPSAKPEAP